MKLLRALVAFVASTVLGVLGQNVLGVYGMLLGSVAGAVVGWYVATRYFDF